MGLVMTIKGADKLREVSALLRDAKRKFVKELSVAFHDAGEQTLWDIRGKILSMEIRGRPKPRALRRFNEIRPGTNLRQRMADAVKLDQKASGDNPTVAFVLDSESMGGWLGGGNIPFHIETRGQWRHPIMGNQKSWVAQTGQKGFFYDEIDTARDNFEKACDDAITRFVEQVQEEI